MSGQPYRRFAVITPSNDVISPPPDAIHVSGGGHLTVVGSDDVTVSFQTTGPMLFPISPKKVTTDTSNFTIIALYLD
jgi:hypothetical protein